MKKVLAVALVALAVLSCNNNVKQQQAQADATIDSLRVVMAQQDSLISSVFHSLETVVGNLQAIKQRENIINQAVISESGRLGESSVARISDDISAIDSLLQRNKKTIESLRGYVGALKQSKLQVQTLEALVSKLSAQVTKGDTEIAALRRQLEERNFEVSTLNTAVSGLTEERAILQTEVVAKSDLLSTAYYISDSKKNLIKNNIVNASGFIGRTLKINENRNLDSFVKIDTRTFDRLPIDGKKPVLVSAHPAGSYQFTVDQGGVEWLQILDAAKFWELTKVLVVSYK